MSQRGSLGSHLINLNCGILPDAATIESAVDTYFWYCHGQPYCYFQEENFRRRLIESTLPPWLLLAVIATATGLSDDRVLQGRQSEASDYFAAAAWKEINDRMFQEEDFMTIHTVQAANMLAVIDFAAGRYKQSWVKIGLSVRYAQALDLLSEPDPSLPLANQEEHRKTAWSVYLLDRAVSCSPERTPTLQDADCTLGLPLSPDFGSSTVAERLTLTRLEDKPEDAGNLGYPGVLYLIASTLGRIQRCWLRRSLQPAAHLPWNSRSEFASIYSTLLTCESCLAEGLEDFDSTLDKEIINTGGETKIDPALGLLHFTYALYFLSQCLLHHPFLFRHQLQSTKALIPPSFLRHVLLTCHENAKGLSRVLQTVLKRRLGVSSFIGYCAVVAGTTHRLFENHHDPTIQTSSRNLYRAALDFLAQAPGRWRHYPRLARALADFNPDPDATSAMVSPSVHSSIPPHPNAEEIWKLLDYGRLSERGREASPEHNISTEMRNVSSQLQTPAFGSSLSDFDITSCGDELLNTNIDDLWPADVVTMDMGNM
ncbi:fungal-specific transcription factor domain-containing protein [Xylaria cf. heliscus]|nr:fungal-specific transcription factor domain-containing protein [Xylaria cf. heliscus]